MASYSEHRNESSGATDCSEVLDHLLLLRRVGVTSQRNAKGTRLSNKWAQHTFRIHRQIPKHQTEMLARLLHIPDVYDSTLAQDIIYTKVLNIFHSLPCILRGLIYDPVCIDYSGPNGRTTDEL